MVVISCGLAVDLYAFGDLTARADLAEDGRQRLALLDEALGLWRGEPYAVTAEMRLNDMEQIGYELVNGSVGRSGEIVLFMRRRQPPPRWS